MQRRRDGASGAATTFPAQGPASFPPEREQATPRPTTPATATAKSQRKLRRRPQGCGQPAGRPARIQQWSNRELQRGYYIGSNSAYVKHRRRAGRAPPLPGTALPHKACRVFCRRSLFRRRLVSDVYELQINAVGTGAGIEACAAAVRGVRHVLIGWVSGKLPMARRPRHLARRDGGQSSRAGATGPDP